MSIDGQDQDRRAEGATRVPFEAMVEVGGALGPSFEAQAVDVSEEGMHLKTAYLPEVGQPLTCRFDIGAHDSVLASGEVVWRREASKGGEFGLRFSDLDEESATALGRIVGTGTMPPAPRAPGAKVRLHIDGLGSPMRARIKSDSRSELMVGSELGFLQVGKQLELEDAETGEKRPARIDRVEVEIQPESRVPQLVVALRYDDEIPVDAEEPRETTPDPAVLDGDKAHAAADDAHADADSMDDEAEDASDRFKGAIAKSAAKITPALEQFMKRTKTAVALLAAKRAAAKESESLPPRRTTAPPPGGGLHASGRKVVRGDSMYDATKDAEASLAPKKMNRRKVALGAAAGVALLLGAIAMRKPASLPPAPAAANDVTANAAAPANPDGIPAANGEQAAAPNVANGPMSGAMNAMPTMPGTPGTMGPSGMTVSPPAPPMQGGPTVSDAPPLVNDGADEDTASAKKKHYNVTPFTNGAVSHGNVLRLKMDGPIEKIEGAPETTGFTVEIPGRRSLEAAAPLAARDSRIASIKVENNGPGAELSLSFKDGVPNYIVRAKGDTLEIVLASLGSVAPSAPAAGGASPNVAITPAKATGGLKHHKKRH